MAVRIGRLVPTTTRFFVCDLQEKFRSVIEHFDKIVTVSQRLINAAKFLRIPVIVTEQYPQALGSTVSELNGAFDAATTKTYPKKDFTMVIPEVEHELKTASDLKSIVLFGIETHVCVQQTALDLLERGFDVHIVADAVSSRSHTDRMIAIERMRQAGAFVTTHESVLFELMRSSTHPSFKTVQPLIREVLPSSGLVSSATSDKKGSSR
eukprot:m.1637346 g.1637346  ORF g.1637346 m.1637346 type:complete len:209 (+) comp25726_c0_seq1:395-1021(+)